MNPFGLGRKSQGPGDERRQDRGISFRGSSPSDMTSAVKKVATLGGKLKMNKDLIGKYYCGCGNSKLHDLSGMRKFCKPFDRR